MTDRPAIKPWPLNGYAPGGYLCKCLDCDKEFQGDKRAMQCLDCAVVWAKRCLIDKPEAGEAVGWETDAEWDLELRAFAVANNSNLPEDVRNLVSDLWRQYCIAAEPASSPLSAGDAGEIERLQRELSTVRRDALLEGRRQAFDEVGQKAREYAALYPEASDGRNTFIIFAEWAEVRP